jgi:hypothetical protein
MTNVERMSEPEIRMNERAARHRSGFVLRTSFVIGYFDIRHFPVADPGVAPGARST